MPDQKTSRKCTERENQLHELTNGRIDEIEDAAPDEAARNERYTIAQAVEEVKTTMAMSGLPLTGEELLMLTDYAEGRISADELRKAIIGDIKIGIENTEE